jgi:hypothetical protein
MIYTQKRIISMPKNLVKPMLPLFLVSMLLAAGGAIAQEKKQVTQEQMLKGELSQGHFEKTGQMVISRYSPDAILLKSGEVLVYGGQIDTDAADFKLGVTMPNAAELYNPTTGKFRLTGSLQVVRADSVATLLQDGRVLIVGGYIGYKPVDHIELYDPATGQFQVVAHLKVARDMPGAVTLPNGKVLIVGGRGEKETLDSAELFDPKTLTTQLLDSKMQDKRIHPKPILLDDGRVLIAGAFYSNLVDFFDWKTNQFSAGPSLLEMRHTSQIIKLKNGKVLITGGAVAASEKSVKLIHLYTSELFDPKSNSWRKTGSIQEPYTSGHVALLDNGKVFLAGEGICAAYNRCELRPIQLYNPKTEQFEFIGHMKKHYTAPPLIVLPNHKLLVVGKTIYKPKINAELYAE